MAFLPTLILALVVAWATHGAQFPGLVGLNDNEDLVLNSGEQRTVLANGVDIIASFSTLSSQMAAQSSMFNSQAAVISTQTSTMDTLKSTIENHRSSAYVFVQPRV